MIRIAASVLSADFARLGEEVRAVEAAGADWIHLDVMDGHFVPNLTMGPDLVRGVRSHTRLPLDVHLMVERPSRFVDPFADAGADYLSIHVECDDDIGATLARIRERGVHPALVLNPDTPLEAAGPWLAEVDLLLIMSVHPGFGAQAFLPSSLDKVRQAREWRERHGLSFLLEIDGGVKVANTGEVAEAGAEVLVSGSGIFRTPDYAATIRSMRQAAGPSAETETAA